MLNVWFTTSNTELITDPKFGNQINKFGVSKFLSENISEGCKCMFKYSISIFIDNDVRRYIQQNSTLLKVSILVTKPTNRNIYHHYLWTFAIHQAACRWSHNRNFMVPR